MGPTKGLTKSHKLLRRALETVPGGTNSGARTAITRGVYEGFPVPLPAFIDRGRGSHVHDVDGNEYIDYLLGFGAIILGHSDPSIAQALATQAKRGTIFSSNTEAELNLVEKLIQHVPCAEQVILGSTGSEADAMALRLARAYNGRRKVLKFEGHYHGWHDWQMVGNVDSIIGGFAQDFTQKAIISDGVPQSVLGDVLVAPWNDAGVLETIIQREGSDIAAVICEPYQSNWGVIPPEKGYLELMRKLTKDRGIALIFDEVITGFRLGYGGAQEYTGVTPDLASFAKAISNGFSISAVAGKKKFMESLAQEKVFMAGTLNGNPLAASAGLANIAKLESYGSYKSIFDVGNKMMNGLRDAIADSRVPAVVQGPGPMWSIYFTDLEKIRFTREVVSIKMHPHIRRSAAFFQEIVKSGLLCNPSRYGRMYVSFSHTDEDANETIEIYQKALKAASKVV
jgi:glutamate-1-semialdehyde 2,1-aminomutase